MLLRCVIHPMVFGSIPGKKFLTHLFSLSLTFVEYLHKVMLFQLRTCPKTQITCYAEIYMKAWSQATGAFIMKIGI